MSSLASAPAAARSSWATATANAGRGRARGAARRPRRRRRPTSSHAHHPHARTSHERPVTPLNQLKVQIWADGADKAGILELDKNPLIKGFTTNPSLMAKAGIKDYPAFAKDILTAIPDKPISFEVFSDDLADMERQARLITTWGKNVYTKIPITNTKGESCIPLIRKLAKEGVKLNVTALLTLKQVRETADALRGGAPSVVSVFAGRIADTGRDPVPVHARLRRHPGGRAERRCCCGRARASCSTSTRPRRPAAASSPCRTTSSRSSAAWAADLGEYSLDTVKGFLKDSTGAGFKL